MKSENFKLTVYSTFMLMCIFLFKSFSIGGFLLGILYAQIIEWFVHGWIQHHPFKIFSAYRKNHLLHHKNPEIPASVQPVQYFLIGSIFLLFPFWSVKGFYVGYFFMYLMINVIHYDLHIKNKLLPNWLWNTFYFRLIKSHHEKHHKGEHAHSVTNPYLDYLFDYIKLTNLNNYIAKKLKI